MLKRKKPVLKGESNMVNAQTDDSTQQKPLRLWPGVVIVVLQWLLRFGIPIVEPEAVFYGMFGGLFCGLAIIVWWAFFSRAPRAERWGAVGLMIVALVVMSLIVHESLGPHWFAFYPIPVLSLAFVAWAVASRRLADRPRRTALVATILLACGVWVLVRSDGITGNHADEFRWRWAKTAEQRLLAQADDEPMALPPAPVTVETGAGWPGFRGPDRDGIIRGVRIETDWSASPPVELWRRPIGPGCSSFAVRGSLIYTQEQRGDDEVVACYKVTTGEPVWRHRDTARFWEPHAGAGPRATPTLSDGRVFTFGATGILNALDAGNGAVVWSRNAASDTDVEIPGWGFASSPLVVDDVVIVDTGKLVAYDLANGDPRWVSPVGGEGYCSPHRLTIDGVAQILLLNKDGVISVAPVDGTLLWEHLWASDGRIVQPALIADGDILIGSGMLSGIGMRRIAVMHEPGGWTTEERWTSARMKPYFNDFVVHEGYAFGFVGRRLVCIDIEDGKRKWKGGNYGGQIILLADQDLLLMLSEKGELALVMAIPERLMELARFPAIKGKTWNHPVLVGDILLVRNTQEMVAFRLSLAGS